MIKSCRSPNYADDTVFETEYEKVIVTMPDGTKVTTVKTAKHFADMVAAEVATKKKRKKTAFETDETVFDGTHIMDSRAAAQTAS